MARFFVGTSGWNYKNWRGTFYPEDLPTKAFLNFYARHFSSAEVNYSFYHLPSAATYEHWYATVPADFRFALKLSRYVTHIKRLNEVQQPWNDFLKGARSLKEKLAPILLQLPPSFKSTEENLRRVHDFLAYASKDRVELAIEFRHESCFAEPMLSILRRHETALVLAHSSRFPIPPVTATGSFVYFRFHGPGEWCSSSYSRRDLAPWARQVKSFMKQGLDAYAYFNNDAHGDAVPNAKLLWNSVVQPRARPKRA
jgi:uncharacterized protein YecE (DUF72 family)